MPKYKYVDGVKYRVVPQSVLGYALVREGSDNSLPSGGTEGQVLSKASNADYDVEWSTVESGGGVYVVHGTVTMGDTMTVSIDNSISDIAAAVADRKALIATLINSEGEYYTNLPLMQCELTDGDIDGMEFMMLSAFEHPEYDLIALSASRLIYDSVDGWRFVTTNYNVAKASNTP